MIDTYRSVGNKTSCNVLGPGKLYSHTYQQWGPQSRWRPLHAHKAARQLPFPEVRSGQSERPKKIEGPVFISWSVGPSDGSSSFSRKASRIRNHLLPDDSTGKHLNSCATVSRTQNPISSPRHRSSSRLSSATSLAPPWVADPAQQDVLFRRLLRNARSRPSKEFALASVS